jgi:hypothetical protein
VDNPGEAPGLAAGEARRGGGEVKRLPLWLKIAYTAWFVVWLPAYLDYYGPRNFLWMCDLCNVILLVALWTEHRLLFSSQWVGVFLLSTLWIVDVAGAVLLGVHPVGGTEYMFMGEIPLHIRVLSTYHLFVPLILCWGVWRLGYDRRGPWLETAILWVVLPVTYFLSSPEWDINWIHGLFGKPQTWVRPWLYSLVFSLCYPVVIYLPSHLLALLVFPQTRSSSIN